MTMREICTKETSSFLCMPMMDEERVCNDAKLIEKKNIFSRKSC